ncbi:hypothetical protein [Sandaracinus amylolyticus]|uniref:Long-chain-fatty-acid--luciferin-component ligase n=1 Tax=Sandaracinus amylolyticus TaxID=927083 RepID=A0A0F6SDF9_9BACT|nr:hypothetical protein [Sandaracinus amylolyticus]AKF03374.1 Long-chain-fatty-acid--luciferin-component ligase [Sandaracinus amylolyticus]
MTERDALHARIAASIQGAITAPERDALLFEVARWQAAHNPVFARLCRARKVSFALPLVPEAWPAIPTDAFRYARVATWDDPSLDIRTFRTSGTTSGARGAHPSRDLSLYDLAAERAARDFLFGPRRMRLAMLAPHPDEAPDSSLSYMLGRFVSWFADQVTWCWREGTLDLAALRAALDASVRDGAPLAILGTSFAIVHADDALAPDERWRLPPGSLAMPTGGFKGRSREVDPAEMRALIASRFGLDPTRDVIGEYGMTELSSQMYEREGRLDVLAWVRATPVDPDTLRPVRDGEIGILRIDDLANLDTAVSIQTADLARVGSDGRLTLIGRAPGATPRGCSLAIEEALGRSGR